MVKAWRKGRATVAMSKLARLALQEAHAGRQTDHVVEHGGRRLRDAREGFAGAVRRAGLEGVTPHTIRHTVATWLHGKIETSFTAQLLGHRDEATTKKVYTHASAEHTRAAVDIIDGTLDALPKKTPRRRLDAASEVEIEPSSSNIDKQAGREDRDGLPRIC